MKIYLPRRRDIMIIVKILGAPPKNEIEIALKEMILKAIKNFDSKNNLGEEQSFFFPPGGQKGIIGITIQNARIAFSDNKRELFKAIEKGAEKICPGYEIKVGGAL